MFPIRDVVLPLPVQKPFPFNRGGKRLVDLGLFPIPPPFVSQVKPMRKGGLVKKKRVMKK